jgi:hypothetical protein
MASTINATPTSSGLISTADNSGVLALQTGGTTAVTVDGSQNIGIGTASPSYKLHVRGADATANLVVGNTSEGTQLEVLTYQDDRVVLRANDTSNVARALAFDTGTSERMRIDSSGIVLMGKNTTNVATNGIRFDPDGASFNSIATGNASLYVYNTSVAAYRFYVLHSGTIFATNTTISGISDQRLKENIVDLPDGLNTVMALKPRKFDWKEGKGKDIKGDRGFIAQEFETVFPDMIDEWKDPSPEGEEPYKSVRADLIPVLVKAIQELNAKVDAQATIIAELQARTA